MRPAVFQSKLLQEASEGLVLRILPPSPPHQVRGVPTALLKLGGLTEEGASAANSPSQPPSPSEGGAEGGGRNSEDNAFGSEVGPFFRQPSGWDRASARKRGCRRRGFTLSIARRTSAHIQSALRSFSCSVLSFSAKRPFCSGSMATKPRVKRSRPIRGIR